MSEYYAVQRSGKHLSHYGVSGMKWGVKKAIERGNSRALGRQYKKAAKKLAKLNAKADVGVQKQKAAKYGKLGKSAAGLAVSGGLLMAGGTAAGKHFTNLAKKTFSAAKLNRSRYNEYESHLLGTHEKRFLSAHDKLLKSGASKEVRDKLGRDTINNYNKAADTAYELHKKSNQKLKDQFNRQAGIANSGFSAAKVGSGMAGIGLLTAGIAGSKALAAKRRTTAKGHAKAVAKRDAWKKEMNKAFAGTQYANGNPRHGNRRKRRS